MSTKRLTKVEKRWLRKARQCFTYKKPRVYDQENGSRQWDRAADLARDIWRTLDPEDWRKVR